MIADPWEPPFDGEALKAWQRRHRYSSVTLANFLSVTPATVHNWRRSTEPLKEWIRLALLTLERGGN